MPFPRRRRIPPIPTTQVHLTDDVYADVHADPDHDGKIIEIRNSGGLLDIASLRKFISEADM